MSALTRPEAAAAANAHGWHYLLGAFRTSVAAGGVAEAATVLTIAAEAADESDHLRAHVAAGRVELTVQPATGEVTAYDADLVGRITEALRANGHEPDAVPGRPPQSLEFAIDALDIQSVLPFWQAVLDYVPDPAYPEGALVDPLREGPAVWFQQMDEPRPQRNRIHFDITVPHAVAEQRVDAALAAGGTLVSDARARAFWILADAEGNEICVCTWQDREPPSS